MSAGLCTALSLQRSDLCLERFLLKPVRVELDGFIALLLLRAALKDVRTPRFAAFLPLLYFPN